VIETPAPRSGSTSRLTDGCAVSALTAAFSARDGVALPPPSAAAFACLLGGGFWSFVGVCATFCFVGFDGGGLEDGGFVGGGFVGGVVGIVPSHAGNLWRESAPPAQPPPVATTTSADRSSRVERARVGQRVSIRGTLHRR
jgi:hypothetical protein